jgi:hypothetical protein
MCLSSGSRTVKVAISILLQNLFGRHYLNVWKPKFRFAEVAKVVSGDPPRVTSRRELKHMVVTFIRQVRAPQVENLHPICNGAKRLKKASNIVLVHGASLND